jgi:hypothetical protein
MAVERICMGNDIDRPEGSVHPPRWAEAVLRMFLRPDEAETEYGDLLEAYRDSIYPRRGHWCADAWFVRQVAGYILRAAVMNVCNWILLGLTLCVLTIAFSVVRYPTLVAEPHAVRNLFAVGVGVLFYGDVALRQNHAATSEDAIVRRLGTKWGIAIGVIWIASFISGNIVIPRGPGAKAAILLALVAFILPFLAGAHASEKTRNAAAGIRVGFWSGLISGLMAFLAVAALGYILAFFPGLPGAEIPSTTRAYTATQFQQLNVEDALGGALAQLFLFGGVFSVIGGTVGGYAGILLTHGGPKRNVSSRK